MKRKHTSHSNKADQAGYKKETFNFTTRKK